jgi:hypothetical protein
MENLIHVNGYAMHPLLVEQLKMRTALWQEMQTNFSAASGCGIEIKKVVDGFTMAAGTIPATVGNELRGLLDTEFYNVLEIDECNHYQNGDNIIKLAECCANLIAIYVYG